MVNDARNWFTMHPSKTSFRLISMNRLILIVVLALVMATLNACSTTFDAAEAYKGESAHEIYQHGVDQLRDNDFQNAIKRFEALDVQYPFGSETETSQIYLIYAYYKTSDFVSAEASAGRFIHVHPTNPHVDYVYFIKGLSNYYQNLGVFEKIFTVDLATRDLAQMQKAFNDFSELTRLYPNSCYAPAAHQYMIYLRNLMAKHELEVAQYYYCRCAFVAAANRANLVVRDFEGAPSVPDALVVMVKSYRQLQLTQNMNEAFSVLQANYPNSCYVQQAMQL